jgi:hypothetical protein
MAKMRDAEIEAGVIDVREARTEVCAFRMTPTARAAVEARCARLGVRPGDFYLAAVTALMDDDDTFAREWLAYVA